MKWVYRTYALSSMKQFIRKYNKSDGRMLPTWIVLLFVLALSIWLCPSCGAIAKLFGDGGLKVKLAN